MRSSLARPSGLTAVLALALLLPPAAHGQDETAPAEAPPAVEAPDEKPLRIPLHSHRITLFGGKHFGETMSEGDLTIPPLSFPVPIVIDMEDSAIYGLRYSYQAFERWGFEVSLSRTGTEIANRRKFDRAQAEFVLDLAGNGGGTPAQREAFLQRLDAHSGPYDLDVTYVDFSGVHLFNPRSRWVAEAEAGFGWAFGSLSPDPAIFEQFTHTDIGPDPTRPFVPEILNELEDPTGGRDCPAIGDPCRALKGGSGLTWHAGMAVNAFVSRRVHLRVGLRYRYVDHVTSPGDSYMSPEATVGLGFVLGGS